MYFQPALLTQASTRLDLRLWHLLLRPAIGTDSVVAGTYEYLAPEAMAGAFRANDEPILARENQDAYALGVTAHQMLTRDTHPPFAMEVCRHSVDLLCILQWCRAGHGSLVSSTLPNVTVSI